MRVELDSYIIESDIKLEYFNEIVSYINSNEKRLLEFFKIDKIPNKITVKILSYEPFRDFVVSKYGEILDYYCGDSDSRTNIIRLLNIEDQIKYTRHKNANVEKIKTTALHEIIHQLHRLYKGNYTHTEWFSEGLATNLSNQSYSLVSLDDCDFNRLRTNFSHYSGCYSYAYTILNYVLNNYDFEEIEKLYKSPDYVRERAESIFEEAKSWVRNKLSDK